MATDGDEQGRKMAEAAGREARMAAALRANLRKRKEQQRQRARAADTAAEAAPERGASAAPLPGGPASHIVERPIPTTARRTSGDERGD